MSRAVLSVKDIPFRQVITSFAGLRAHEDGDDFVIGEAEDARASLTRPALNLRAFQRSGDWPVAGRKSGRETECGKKKEDWNGTRKGHRASGTFKQRRAGRADPQKNPAYGTIICRCESVSEGEIVDAITRTLGAKSLDGIKRRVRQGMGRCQAGFCTPRTMEILSSRELGISMEEVCKKCTGIGNVEGS